MRGKSRSSGLTNRAISPSQIRTLDAPGVNQNEHTNIIDWSGDNDRVAVGLADQIYMWDSATCNFRRAGQRIILPYN